MNTREIGEIRRHTRRDRSNMTAIYGCYVNSQNEIVSEFKQSTGIMPENEADKYFGLMKKVLSGSVGKNLLDIPFKTSQVAGSAEHKLLMNLREDRGGSAVIRRHEEDLVLLEVGARELTDVDTPEALRQVRETVCVL